MADIIINEISQNYSYVIGDESFATVALPITSQWGPGYFEPETMIGVSGDSRAERKQTELEDVVWRRFSANQAGIEAFVSTYRGPANNYRLAKDYSYQMAMTLMSAGYDVLVCRLNPGTYAQGVELEDFSHKEKNSDGSYKKDANDHFIGPDGGKFILTAKYAGSFGNRIVCKLQKQRNRNCWNLITYIVDSTGVKYPVENKTFTFEIENSSDSVLHLEEIESDYVYIKVDGVIRDNAEFGVYAKHHVTGLNIIDTDAALNITFSGGADRPPDPLVGDKLQAGAMAFRASCDGQLYDIDDTNHTAKIDVILTAGPVQNIKTFKVGLSYDDTKLTYQSSTMLAAGTALGGGASTMTAADGVVSGTFNQTSGANLDPQSELVKVTFQVSTEITYPMPTLEITDCKDKNNNGVHPFITQIGEAPKVDVTRLMDEAIKKAKERYTKVMQITHGSFNSSNPDEQDAMLQNADYIYALRVLRDGKTHLAANGDRVHNDDDTPGQIGESGYYLDVAVASTRAYQEWLYTEVLDVYDLLLDRLSYAPNRVISPGWDDQDILELTPDADLTQFGEVSPLHWKLMHVAYYARCATAYIDVPKSMKRKYVYNGSLDPAQQGYAQTLARYSPIDETFDIDGTLYPTHSAMFGPWGTYRYVGTGKYCPANPAFLALMIQKSMINNQPAQYEWIQPSSRECKVQIGKMAYTVPQKVLDLWQPEPDQEGGCGVNAIGDIPSVGMSIWGDSTIYENPPAVYQALRNLSTRLLVNALKNQAYRVGLSITWNYNNESAYSKFYVGMTPLLDAMRNVGAIEDYYVRMAADLDKVGQIKANSVIGKIYIVPVGTIQRITIDLIALPPGTSLDQYTAQ